MLCQNDLGNFPPYVVGTPKSCCHIDDKARFIPKSQNCVLTCFYPFEYYPQYMVVDTRVKVIFSTICCGCIETIQKLSYPKYQIAPMGECVRFDVLESSGDSRPILGDSRPIRVCLFSMVV